jgi:hypothetical protein
MPEEAGVELNLRGEFISAERGLFLNCRERGRVVAGYKAIYGPKRKWSEFCRIVKLPRQTSYDLLASAEAEEMIESTESVQSPGKMRRPQVGYNFDTAVDKAVASLNRIFRGMTETQRQQALDALVDRLGGRYENSSGCVTGWHHCGRPQAAHTEKVTIDTHSETLEELTVRGILKA